MVCDCGETLSCDVYYLPSFVSAALIFNSKSVPSPSLFMVMISLFSSKTDMPVPSNATLVGSFEDLKRKNTEEVMIVYTLDHSCSGFVVVGWGKDFCLIGQT